MRSSATDAIGVSFLREKGEHYAIGRENSSEDVRGVLLPIPSRHVADDLETASPVGKHLG
jgi:hypothetical protein